MRRNAIVSLQNWKENNLRKPLYLRGLKGIGKTYLAFEFAKNFFDSFFYLSFENNSVVTEALEHLPKEQIYETLANYFEIPEDLLQSSLLIFDEVYLCPNFLRNLLQLSNEINETDQRPYWMLLSSYDILDEIQKPSVEEVVLYPLQFDEFLSAIGNDWYVEVITAHYKSKKKIPDIVHQELLSIFDEYLWIGGMPDVINEYLSMESSVNVTERQEFQRMILSYGMENVADESISLKCRQVFSTVGEQLKKNNQKFQFNLIRKGITYQMYKEAILFLERHSILYRINEMEKEQQFKLFFSDFSLNKPAQNNELTDVEQSIRIQNYILQTLKQNQLSFMFWESKSQATLDFVIKSGDYYTPVEIKTIGKNKLKSIHSFQQNYKSKKSIRFSDTNFAETEDYINLPLYSAFCLKNND